MRRWTSVLFAALLLAGCNKVKTNTAQGELKVVEAKVDFGETCLKTTSTNVNVDPVVLPVHLTNTGTAKVYVNQFEVQPAEMAAQFFFDDTKKPASLDPNETVEMQLRFLPQTVGNLTANLAVRGETDAPILVPLTGKGSSKPVDPAVSLSCPGGYWGPTVDGCAVKDPEKPYVFFDNTTTGDTSEMTVTFSNAGCPTLEVSSINTSSVDKTLGTFELVDNSQSSFSVKSGASFALKVRFVPLSGQMPAQGYLEGALTMQTNDPAHPQLSIKLQGIGEQPELEITPLLCQMESLTFACDGHFTLKNNSVATVTFNGFSLESGSALFKIAQAPAVGSTLDPNATADLKVDYLPGPTYTEDKLVVDWVGGKSKARLTGGSPPVVDVEPPIALDFDDKDRFQPVIVGNVALYQQQLPLTVHGFTLGTGTAFEMAVNPDDPTGCPAPPAADTKMLPGATLKACVHFTGGAGSSSYLDQLSVKTDDPLRPEALLALRAFLACSRPPVARITAPLGAACPCATGDAGTNDQECIGNTCHATSLGVASLDVGTFVVSGEASYDLVADTSGACTVQDPTGVKQWEWSLTQRPKGSTATLSPVGRGTNPRTTLTFDTEGWHQVQLLAYDKDGMASAPVTFNVYAGP